MGALSFGEITKPFGPRSPEAGNPRYVAITIKIEEGSPFHLTNGKKTPLFFREEAIEKAFKTFNLDDIEKYVGGRGKTPFVDSDKNLYALSRLEKTHEFGGASGGGRPPDPHELMTAALILKYGTSGTTHKIPSKIYSTLNDASKEIKILKDVAHHIETTESDKGKKIEAFDNNFEAFAQAISAADGFLENMPANGKVGVVYGTGRKWATILKPFKLDDHLLFGKKDYNSSDMIVQVKKPKGTTFVGISLKKKGLKGADPTVINKTVIGTDGLLTALVKQGYFGAKQDFNEVYKARGLFFYNVIEKALTNPNPKVRSEALRKVGSPKDVGKFLAGLTTRIQPSQTITKSILTVAQKLGQDNMTKALKGQYPEGGVLNIYFQAFNSILTNPAYAQPIVIALLNIILKTDLTGFLKLRGVPREEFKFTLITGKGKFTGGKIEVGKASELQETFTTSLITKMLNNTSGPSYKIDKTTGKKQAYEPGANAAKLFYTVWLGKNDIADVEIRYKGSIRSEPQFFAVITPHFKNMYKEEVKSSGGHQKW